MLSCWPCVRRTRDGGSKTYEPEDLSAQELPEVYALAREKAVGETGLAEADFPGSCPFTLEQTLEPEE